MRIRLRIFIQNAHALETFLVFCINFCDDSATGNRQMAIKMYSQPGQKIACQLLLNGNNDNDNNNDSNNNLSNNNKQLHENCQRLMFIGIRNRPSSFHLVHTHTHTHTKIERERHAQPMSDAKWKASRDSATATTTTTTSSGARLTERCCEWQLNHLHF